MTRNNKHLVVLGGGVAGHRVAYKLQRKVRVTLIDPKTYFEVPMAMPRQLSAPGELPSIIPFETFLPEVEHVRSIASRVSETSVTLVDGREIAFDVLVIATGANYRSDFVKPVSGTPDERLGHYRRINTALRGAKNVLIVGGGPIGVELAGEILQDYPDKNLTLVESAPTLLPNANPRIQGWARSFFEKRGATVITGTPVATVPPAQEVALAPGSVVTADGRELRYDVAFWCLGARPNAEFMRSHFAASLNGSGEIRVDHFLRVVGTSNILAIGDATDIPHKGAIAVHAELQTVVDNASILLEGGASAKLKRFSGVRAPNSALYSLGRRNGLLDLPIGRFRVPWLARKLKAGRMLVDHMRHSVGLE